jgi:WD40 repeat protein
MISIWDADTGERVLERLEGHTGAVLSIEFSPGGNFLVSGIARFLNALPLGSNPLIQGARTAPSGPGIFTLCSSN